MPYTENSELPPSVRGKLPEHAQDIYREAFNSAYKEYRHPESRRGNMTLEEVAHAVAWKAVEKVYVKNDSGEWIKKSS